ncbi:bifunctional UDP-N-acetylmuramoyl-tripeptide:D-alanyl-D-alanine ligase/alanine racemase [Rhodocytophaga aerolata]|uniref:Alanine racemase n=1 Tax=Rhodocytophaga aerolata TaxID=455078 RepID=A0ABT8R1I5_9BACT|nr:bifunctional UDP-N-acetylmuramoyl-tripeptide:D-alanyl-D-alanine ligase/alanine racemase [Rhodocytophaga aerolata]MDO1445957.1 bifunctional UDP-N-acetylmuramoyl-tripeptide:D-alanyl-D-alanine ligase/alanine racemase [Rhodocytophaga aerolata]
MLSFQQLLISTKGQVLQQRESLPVSYLLTDSRKVVSPLYSLFFAIKGERHDGHQFIRELYSMGVRQFVVEHTQGLHLSAFPEATILQVENSVRALQQVAALHREQFTIPVMGITGSNGKTIVKEWLATLLGKQYNIVRSPKSYNSQIGVPLSVWQINTTHTLGIFEAGISRPAEMAYLEKVIKPTIGLFTNIGTAHDEGFESSIHKVREKLQLFTQCQTIIYCRDHQLIHEQMALFKRPEQQTFTWSKIEAAAEVFLHEIGQEHGQSVLAIRYTNRDWQLQVPFVDDASLENVMHCITAMLYFGLEVTEIQSRLRMLQPVSMRLEMKEGINGCYLIDDTYNNDLAGLTMGLDFLNLQKQRDTKTLIVSDVLETGLPEKELYQHIGRLLETKGVNRLLGIGEVISRNKEFFAPGSEFYPTTASFLKQPLLNKFSNELILIKGARSFAFEQIVHKLLQKTHGTILEINLEAISHNLNYYKSKLHSQTKIMVMVKAFAYGSGSAEIASMLQFHRVDYLAVAYADEGVLLRENGIHLPIMVMNPSPQTFDKLLNYRLEPELYSFAILNSFIQYLQDTGQQSPVHIKLDTGMHRLGFEEQDLPQLIQQLKIHPELTIATIFSHLAAADEEEYNYFSTQQMERFRKMAAMIEGALLYSPIKHILNSAGIVRFPAYQLDMVRLGIGLYGVEATNQEQAQLETVGTLKTTISQIKKVKAGDTIGYSRKGKVTRDSRIATIAIGYADGFDRRLSNGVGKVWINGKLAPLIGNVCMDMSMVDITDLEAEEGDEVIIFGKQYPISEMARQIGTIPYEILTGVSERVKRVFYTS